MLPVEPVLEDLLQAAISSALAIAAQILGI
jgi:hypothetical protein